MLKPNIQLISTIRKTPIENQCSLNRELMLTRACFVCCRHVPVIYKVRSLFCLPLRNTNFLMTGYSVNAAKYCVYRVINSRAILCPFIRGTFKNFNDVLYLSQLTSVMNFVIFSASLRIVN